MKTAEKTRLLTMNRSATLQRFSYENLMEEALTIEIIRQAVSGIQGMTDCTITELLISRKLTQNNLNKEVEFAGKVINSFISIFMYLSYCTSGPPC